MSNSQEISHFKSLGPEPLEKNFNSKYLKEYFFGRNRTIKDILMDQKCVSGLGNIYVNEILFLCGIRPTRKTKVISNSEINKIIKNTKKILKKSIRLGAHQLKTFLVVMEKKDCFSNVLMFMAEIMKSVLI